MMGVLCVNGTMSYRSLLSSHRSIDFHERDSFLPCSGPYPGPLLQLTIVLFPVQWIASDIPANPIQSCLVANDMLIIISLPNSLRHIVTTCLDLGGIDLFRHGSFIAPNDGRDAVGCRFAELFPGGVPGGGTLQRAPTRREIVDHKDPMQV